METVLIADDEKNIREGLKHILNWTSLGFEICGETVNGDETLHFILTQNPSLVLLDIRMPKMYGTDIVRIAREKGFRGKFIFLSGYSEFSYAQAAIHYGVNFYLTKPIDEDELLDAVTKIKLALEKEHSDTDQMQLLKNKAKNVILHEIITGTYGSSSAPLTSEKLESINLIADVYQVVIYENFNTDSENCNYSFADLLKITNRGNHTFEHFEEDGNEVILLKGPFALSKFQSFLEHYEQNTPHQVGSPLDSLFLAYGRPVSCLDEIYLSYEEALTLRRRRFFCIQGQHTLGYEELPDVRKRTLEISNERLESYCDQLIDYLLAFNRNMVAETFYDLEEYLYNVKNDISAVKLFLTDLYFRMKERIYHTFSTTEIPFLTNSDIIDYIENCHYLYEIILFISEQATKVLDATGNPSRSTVLDDILYYIDHNYQNNIKLEGIAPLFGYNSAYLGKLIAKSTGENFNSYVDHKRIELSKELLKENHLKVYEVSEQVGYKNVDYFHKKFKKYVGISPAEYRKTF